MMETAYQKVHLVDASGNLVSLPTASTPSVKTPAYTTTSTSGSIATGTISIAIANIGTAAGQIQGYPLPPNTSVSWEAPTDSTLASISYDATGTTFSISTLT